MELTKKQKLANNLAGHLEIINKAQKTSLLFYKLQVHYE